MSLEKSVPSNSQVMFSFGPLQIMTRKAEYVTDNRQDLIDYHRRSGGSYSVIVTEWILSVGNRVVITI